MKRRPRAAVRRRVIKCPRRRAGRSGREISEFPAAACRKWKIPAQSCGRRPSSLHKSVQPPQNHANLLIFRARAAPPPATTPLPDPRARNPLPRKGFSPSEPPEFRRRATKPLPTQTFVAEGFADLKTPKRYQNRGKALPEERSGARKALRGKAFRALLLLGKGLDTALFLTKNGKNEQKL